MISQVGWDCKTGSGDEVIVQGKREEIDTKRGTGDSSKSSSTGNSTEEDPGCVPLHSDVSDDDVATVFLTDDCDKQVTNIGSEVSVSLSADEHPFPLYSGPCSTSSSNGGVNPDVDLLARFTASEGLSIPLGGGGGGHVRRQGDITYDFSADRGSADQLGGGTLMLHILSSVDAFEPVLRVVASSDPMSRAAAETTSPIPERRRATESLALELSSGRDCPFSREGSLRTPTITGTSDQCPSNPIQSPDFIDAGSPSKDEAGSSGCEAVSSSVLLDSKATLRKLDERSLYSQMSEVSGSAILLEPGVILVSGGILT